MCNRTTFFVIAGIWILLQIVYVALYKEPNLISDPGMYVYYAQECVEHGTMYPDYSNYHDYYIFNPGIVNLYILWINIFGSINGIHYLFVAMNAVILFMIKRISRQIKPDSAVLPYAAAYMFMLMPSNFLITAQTFSEIPFELCCSLSFMLTFGLKKRQIIAAGICVALAYWIRPLGIAWIVAALIYLIAKTRTWRVPAIYLTAVIVTLGGIAVATHRNFPDYVCTATTGGFNLIMSAHDRATGITNISIFLHENEPGYIAGATDSTKIVPVKRLTESATPTYRRSDRYTYTQYDSIYMNRAKAWIINNPTKYAQQLPIKFCALFSRNGIFYMGGSDDRFAGSELKYKVYCYIWSIYKRIELLCIPIFLIYWIGFIGFLSWRRLDYTYLTMPVIFATGITLLTVTQARYNFIMLPWIYIAVCLTVIKGVEWVKKRHATDNG